MKITDLSAEPPIFVTCPPGPAYLGITNPTDHNITETADPGNAVEQHRMLVRCMEKAGCLVRFLPELEGHPNSVFTKDTSLCLPEGYVRLRMGLKTRMGEEAWMAGFLESQGIPCLGSIEPPGTVEGGDIILTGKTALTGHSSRTNREGIRQLAKILKSHRIDVRSIPVPQPFLHIGGTMSLISHETLLCVKDLFPDEFYRGFQRIKVPNTGFISGNVISPRNGSIIADLANTYAIEALEHHGYNVCTIDLSEFIKGTGGPSCLVLEATTGKKAVGDR